MIIIFIFLILLVGVPLLIGKPIVQLIVYLAGDSEFMFVVGLSIIVFMWLFVSVCVPIIIYSKMTVMGLLSEDVDYNYELSNYKYIKINRHRDSYYRHYFEIYIDNLLVYRKSEWVEKLPIEMKIRIVKKIKEYNKNHYTKKESRAKEILAKRF